jgi:hypothetical protein
VLWKQVVSVDSAARPDTHVEDETKDARVTQTRQKVDSDAALLDLVLLAGKNGSLDGGDGGKDDSDRETHCG